MEQGTVPGNEQSPVSNCKKPSCAGSPRARFEDPIACWVSVPIQATVELSSPTPSSPRASGRINLQHGSLLSASGLLDSKDNSLLSTSPKTPLSPPFKPPTYLRISPGTSPQRRSIEADIRDGDSKVTSPYLRRTTTSLMMSPVSSYLHPPSRRASLSGADQEGRLKNLSLYRSMGGADIHSLPSQLQSQTHEALQQLFSTLASTRSKSQDGGSIQTHSSQHSNGSPEHSRQKALGSPTLTQSKASRSSTTGGILENVGQ